MKSIDIAAPAKINLGLRILDKLPDGYHTIESLFAAVTLNDDLTVTITDTHQEIKLNCSGIPSPQNSSNLAWKAADLFRKKTSMREGVEIRLHKRIPSPGGLGGGSSDAASVVIGLSKLTGIDNYAGIAGSELGSDVPFFLSGHNAAIVTGRGETIRECIIPEFHAVLIGCGENVPTPIAYQLWDESVSHLTEACLISNYTALNFGVWHEGKPFPVRLDNHFLPVLAERFPGVKKAEVELKSTWSNWGLSGSGPVFFVLFPSEDRARYAEELLNGKFPWVFRCRSRHIGASSNG